MVAVGARTWPRRPIAYACVHGTYHIILSRTHLHTLTHNADRQTDRDSNRQTDRQRDRQTVLPHSLSLPLSRAHALSLSGSLTETYTYTRVHKHSHLDGIDNAENRVVVCVPQVDADRPA